MFLISEQISATIKINLDAQRIVTASIGYVFEGYVELLDLQMAAGAAAIAESVAAANVFFLANSPGEIFTLQAEERRLQFEKTFAYGRRVSDIGFRIYQELTTLAKTHLAETSSDIVTLSDSFNENIPRGQEQAGALIKSTLADASAGYEQLTKSTDQAVELLTGHIVAAANEFSYKYSRVFEK